MITRNHVFSTNHTETAVSFSTQEANTSVQHAPPFRFLSSDFMWLLACAISVSDTHTHAPLRAAVQDRRSTYAICRWHVSTATPGIPIALRDSAVPGCVAAT
eukprot:1343356-Rhodomonas_salina.2